MCNSVNINWQQEAYTELYTQDELRGILWWKTRIQKLRVIRGNIFQGIYPVHSKEKEWSHILGNRLTNNADTGYSDVGIKSTGKNVIKYKEKLENIVKKYNTETEINVYDQ